MQTIEAMSYGGFWRRFGAVIVDNIVMVVVLAMPMMMYYGDAYFEAKSYAGPLDFLVTFVLPLILTIWFWVKYGATPGKLALSLRVVDAHTGKNITVGKSILRLLGYIVSALPLCLGFFWIVFDSKKRGWHDLIAGTVVIKKQPTRVEFDIDLIDNKSKPVN